MIKLVGRLQYLDLSLIDSKEEYLCFWLNCFNYLILFTIFYRNLNLTKEEDWESFLRQNSYNIGGKEFSFDDMQYIIFGRTAFFYYSYEPPEHIKKLEIIRDKKFDDYINIKYIPFILNLPMEGFLGPTFYNKDIFKDQVNKKIVDYIENIIYYDQDNNLIICSEIFLDYYGQIFNIDANLKNFQWYSQTKQRNKIFPVIEKSDYKKILSKKMNWLLTFEKII